MHNKVHDILKQMQASNYIEVYMCTSPAILFYMHMFPLFIHFYVCLFHCWYCEHINDDLALVKRLRHHCVKERICGLLMPCLMSLINFMRINKHYFLK